MKKKHHPDSIIGLAEHLPGIILWNLVIFKLIWNLFETRRPIYAFPVVQMLTHLCDICEYPCGPSYWYSGLLNLKRAEISNISGYIRVVFMAFIDTWTMITCSNKKSDRSGLSVSSKSAYSVNIGVHTNIVCGRCSVSRMIQIIIKKKLINKNIVRYGRL